MKGKIGFPVWSALIAVLAGVGLVLEAAGTISVGRWWLWVVLVVAAAFVVGGLAYSTVADRPGFCPYGRLCPFRGICPFAK